MKFKKIVRFSVIVTGVLAFGSLLWWYVTTEPLESFGMSGHQTPTENGFIIELNNTGRFKINLVDVTVNGKKPPGPVYLGISFDSSSLVTISPDPDIEFMNIGDHPIYPWLKGEEMMETIKQKKHTPINYGVRIVNNNYEPIKYVTVRYKYLGLTKTLKITRWFENWQ